MAESNHKILIETLKEEFYLDFEDYEKAYKHYSDKELKEISRLFSLMNSNFLVKLGSSLTLFALQWHIPFVQTVIKNTLFNHFVGGTTLLDCQSTIDRLWSDKVVTVLDYGVEGVNSDEGFEKTTLELERSIDFAATNDSTPIIVCKVTGLGRDELLIKIGTQTKLSDQEEKEKKEIFRRLERICSKAEQRKVGVFIDAEESWIQTAIDEMTIELMLMHNKNRVNVYKTYQMYQKDKLEELKKDHAFLRKNNCMLGAKIVRGAYMDKETKFAEEKGIPTVINPSKDITDSHFNQALDFCVKNHESLASCCASHNAESNYLFAALIHENKIVKDHPHLNFCQLFGMSDNITYNLAEGGYNVAKYLPYGVVKDVIPYLIRRAKENTSVTGDMSRELGMINEEMLRRGLK